jgi:signal transduction histidine kinase
VNRFRFVPREYWFDLLIAALAVAAMLEVIVGRNLPGAPLNLWFALPAIPIMVAPIFARRRWPFGGPATYWLLSVGVAFIDWRLIPFAVSLFVLGLAVAFLLGEPAQPLQRQGRPGARSRLPCDRHAPDPGHSLDELIFIPLEFAITWVAGFALRERVEQAEAAELRAVLAERERDAAARIAVAEERARIARELHDIVAHAVSVMVLQVGAVRHKLPSALAEDSQALKDVERVGRTALAEMRQLLAAMRREGDEAELLPQPGLDGLDSLLEEVGRAPVEVHRRRAGSAATRDRAIRLSHRQEGLTNALTRAGQRCRRNRPLSPDELDIEVRDDGVEVRRLTVGHGLIGIRERVKIYGGEMTAGAKTGFVLGTRSAWQRPAIASESSSPTTSRFRAGFRMLLPASTTSKSWPGRAMARGDRQGRPLSADRADGHPHARARRPPGDAAVLAADTPPILILTTFDLDEYVYEPSGKANGFVLKDDLRTAPFRDPDRRGGDALSPSIRSR